MTTLTAPVTKEIKYNRLTKDYDMLLNGEYVGSERSYHAAEVELDRLTYERLDRAGVEPEMPLSATALDGGSHPDDIATEYAEALPKPCATCSSDGSPCVDCNPYGNCPVCRRPIRQRLFDPQTGICLDCQPGHDLTLPDVAECPDISAPQPCEDLPGVNRTAEHLNALLIAELAAKVAALPPCREGWQPNIDDYPVLDAAACARYSTPPLLADPPVTLPSGCWGYAETCHNPATQVLTVIVNDAAEIALCDACAAKWRKLHVVLPPVCGNCDGPHHIQRCPEVWRALTG